jgi:hypothetical protein
MTNKEKVEQIRQWIDPEERITVHFRDTQDLKAEVIGCSDVLVDLSIEPRVTYMRQTISLPLSRTEVSEDLSHYTRDPDRPLTHRRLMLTVDDTQPPIIY